MFFIYNIIINLIILISPVIVLVRIIKNKEDKYRFKEKFCFFSKKRGSGKILWFHGSSVGEILSIIPLIEFYLGPMIEFLVFSTRYIRVNG